MLYVLEFGLGVVFCLFFAVGTVLMFLKIRDGEGLGPILLSHLYAPRPEMNLADAQMPPENLRRKGSTSGNAEITDEFGAVVAVIPSRDNSGKPEG